MRRIAAAIIGAALAILSLTGCPPRQTGGKGATWSAERGPE